MTRQYYDNSRVSDWRTCPRYFYFRHQRHWDGTGFNKAAFFGHAWHAAMDVVWQGMLKVGWEDDPTPPDEDAIIKAAFLAWEADWVENGGTRMTEMSPEDAKALSPHTPAVAMEMLYEYIDKRRAFFTGGNLSLVSVEQPFAVPLDPSDTDTFYVGRLDKVVNYKGQLICIEHKTTSLYKRDGGFKDAFRESFVPNSQVDGYFHAGRFLHGEKFKAIWIDAALVHGNVHDQFEFIPVRRTKEQLESWLWEVRYYISEIRKSKEALSGEMPANYLPAFPKDTGNCFKFMKACMFIEPCRMWANPQEHELPVGLVEREWNPFDVNKLDSIGMKI